MAEQNQPPRAETAVNGRWKLSVAFLLGLLLGAGLLWIGFRNETLKTLTQTPIETQERESGEVSAGDTSSRADSPQRIMRESFILVDAQAAGMSTLIRKVNIPQNGWGGVYEDNMGQPGNALGAARLDAGLHENVTVSLLRATATSASYHAVIHRDNGDRVFSLADDFPIRDANDNPVVTRFQTL